MKDLKRKRDGGSRPVISRRELGAARRRRKRLLWLPAAGGLATLTLAYFIFFGGVIHSKDLAEPAQTPATPAFEPLAFPAILPGPQSIDVPILMFHHVGGLPPDADEIRTDLTVPAANFEEMMSYLAQEGYHPVTFRQLFKALYFGQDLPGKPVLLTFDDGYEDNFSVALPVLRRYGFPATFYLVTGKMGTDGYMSWEQVAELDRLGMDVGSHTESHPDLTTLSSDDLGRELRGSAEEISAYINHPAYWFCYPAGKYDSQVVSEVSRAGYLLAVTTEPGQMQSNQSPLGLTRYRIHATTTVEVFGELVREET